MDFKDQITQLASRVEKILPQLKTEEATKNALIMPFIQVLGYDVFNPFEVNPEFIADIGIKKGEKVDYAIMQDGEPTILIECKHHLEKLDPHNSQLFRYFHTTKAKFGLLTNGLNYRFYTDLEEKNKMDSTPFLEFNITEIKETELVELKKFHKSYFDVESITNTASELKYLNELKTLLNKEMILPSENFVSFFTKQIYSGVLTAKVKEQFGPIIKRSFNLLISDAINERLKSALNQEKQIEVAEAVKLEANAEPASLIVTTEEELEGFYIVKSLLRQNIDSKRITYRDAQSYFAILLDDNNRKTISRLYLDGVKKYLVVLDEAKKEVKYEIQSLDEIYKYSETLLTAVARLEKK
ncbi:type I restriction enzyme HsdR N-terminal domain-containing protein [Mucilaginibacter rigui]|uniref:Type I restriction enzyme HsdR N-terminal domain-containing protein n=1 Tax=Mucilaginibacter rigui TaxID=534635 RepID=A0ABR7WZ67_9SPHI|nr:type I restriction endonuclease [Mucilaginibacter rigui]MBD1383644.1 type I restriction enzyme HsdR N-terminal domain-containing protein [Mucilaginibacter rigui]